MEKNSNIIPFLKWAGGKRWLFNKPFVDGLPSFERYIEPFLGGGAGFFAMKPKNAVLSDINPELVNVYRQIRDNPLAISDGLAAFQAKHGKDFYYEMRAAAPNNELEQALRTLYLNRSCWNGLYRLNKKGQFNVPIGTKDSIVLKTDSFSEISKALHGVTLEVCDFSRTISQSGPGDFVFVDPPYTVKHNMNGFVKYNESIFTWEDQKRLYNCASEASARGANVFITNADHKSIRELYEGAKQMEPVQRASILSGNPEFRSITTELLIQL